jgi:hypothetical protein
MLTELSPRNGHLCESHNFGSQQTRHKYQNKVSNKVPNDICFYVPWQLIVKSNICETSNGDKVENEMG